MKWEAMVLVGIFTFSVVASLRKYDEQRMDMESTERLGYALAVLFFLGLAYLAVRLG